MSASVYGLWPGMPENAYDDQPGFWSCSAWANWMAERECDHKVERAMRVLKVEALRTGMTEGMADSDVEWVSPDELGFAALRLRVLIQESSPGVEVIIESYSKSADEDPREELIRDLWEIAEIALWCREQGAKIMTLEVSW